MKKIIIFLAIAALALLFLGGCASLPLPNICGNGVCEPAVGESLETCCIDCEVKEYRHLCSDR